MPFARKWVAVCVMSKHETNMYIKNFRYLEELRDPSLYKGQLSSYG